MSSQSSDSAHEDFDDEAYEEDDIEPGETTEPVVDDPPTDGTPSGG